MLNLKYRYNGQTVPSAKDNMLLGSKLFKFFKNDDDQQNETEIQIPTQNASNTNLNNSNIDNVTLTDYYKGINAPKQADYTSAKNKIASIKELTKAPDVTPETGFNRSEKIGLLGGILGNVLGGFDRSREGQGMVSDNGNQDILNYILKQRQADKEKMYNAALRNREYGTDIDKVNADILQNQFQNEMNLARYMGEGSQSNFANQMALANAKEEQEYRKNLNEINKIIAMSKAQGGEKEITGSLLNAVNKMAEADKGIFARRIYDSKGQVNRVKKILRNLGYDTSQLQDQEALSLQNLLDRNSLGE